MPIPITSQKWSAILLPTYLTRMCYASYASSRPNLKRVDPATSKDISSDKNHCDLRSRRGSRLALDPGSLS